MLTRSRDQLLPPDPLQDLLLRSEFIDWLRVPLSELANRCSRVSAGLRECLVRSVLPRPELDQEIPVQMDPFPGRSRPLQTLGQFEHTRPKVTVERLVKQLLLGGDLAFFGNGHFHRTVSAQRRSPEVRERAVLTCQRRSSRQLAARSNRLVRRQGTRSAGVWQSLPLCPYCWYTCPHRPTEPLASPWTLTI